MNPLNHVAIIMDGNGRWGLKNKKSRNEGHQEGLKSIERVIKFSIKKNIKFLTLYAFSTENWKRPDSEIKFLFILLEKFLTEKLSEFNKNNIKLKIIGKKNFSKKINNLLRNSEKVTKFNNKIQINLALNYGSKSELIYSFKKIIKKKIKINEQNITANLYTRGIPNPDLIIRTGNTRRLSNFLLWQASYSEIFFEKKLWPEFNNKDYLKIINNYYKIKRNFGNI